jgi:hypothetical protein
MIAATGKIVEVVVTQGFYYLFMAAKKESYFLPIRA